MSALGQKQPPNTVKILTSEWLVLGYTGHSPLCISEDTSGCFRPEAATEFERYNGPTLRSLVFLDQRQPAWMVANGVEAGIARQPLNRPSDRRCKMFIQ